VWYLYDIFWAIKAINGILIIDGIALPIVCLHLVLCQKMKFYINWAGNARVKSSVIQKVYIPSIMRLRNDKDVYLVLLLGSVY
jgi:hypothetical protein